MKTTIRMLPALFLLLLWGFPAVEVCKSCSQTDVVFWRTAPAYANPAKTPELWWRDLQLLDYQTGNVPAELKKYNGSVVRVPGFIIPLEDGETSVSEFLLVPFPMACIHVPAPPPNQIVHVKMEKGKKAPVLWFDPVWARGRLEIKTTNTIYTEASFFMTGIGIDPYEPKRK
jgi:uncharacterized protein